MVPSTICAIAVSAIQSAEIRGRSKERGSYFIAQLSFRATGFVMLGRDEAGGTNWISVPVRELVDAQANELASVFTSTLQEMDEAGET